jgi:hypothetical protein
MINNIDRKKTYILASIFIIALIIRIAYSLIMAETFASHKPWMPRGLGYFGDSHLYHRVAYNLYKGNGFSGSFSGEAYGIPLVEVNQFKPLFVRGPMYPLFVSSVYKFACNQKDMESKTTWIRCWNKVRIAQCILDSIICLLVFFIVRLIYPPSFWPAIIASGLHAFNIYNIFFTKDIMSTSMDTFLLISSIFLFIKALKEKKTYCWILSGMLLGMLVLSRPEFVLAIFVLSPFIFIVNRGELSYAFKKAMIFTISAFIVISPWTIRNYVVFKKPILVSTGITGYSLFAGTWWSHDTWKWGEFPDGIFKDQIEKKRVNEVRRKWVFGLNSGTMEIQKYDDELREMAFDRMRENPRKVVLIWLKRIPSLWWQNYIQLYPMKWPPGIFFVVYFALAAYAFLTGNREDRVLMWPLALLFMYLTLALLPFAVTPRYGTALIPGIISLAGIGIWKTIPHFKSMREQKERNNIRH